MKKPITGPVYDLTPAQDMIQFMLKYSFFHKQVTQIPESILTTKEIDAAPEKIYYLHIKLRNSQTNGLLYLSLYDSSWYNDKSTVEFVVSRGNNDFIILIPGRYVKGPLYLEPGDWPDREQIFEKVVLLESSGKPAETDMPDFISRKSR